VIISPVISGAATGYTYSWSAPPGAQLSGINTASLATNMVGIYTITVSNPAGCTKTLAITVSSCTDVSVPEASAYITRLFPNPAENTVNIETGMEIFSLEVYNSLGQIISRQEFMGNRHIISMEEMPAGIYIFRISGKLGTVCNTKVLKR